MRTIRISAVLLAFSAVPALAQDQVPSSGGNSAPATTLACTNAGLRYQPGEFACIAACHEQRRLARCDAATDKATWTYVQESCPTSMINAPWPGAWSEVPALAAMSPIPINVDRSAIPPDVRFAFVSLDATSQ